MAASTVVIRASMSESYRALSSNCEGTVGRTLIIAGALLIVAGLLVTLGDKLPIKLGRLPGDIRVEGRHGGFYFPVVTCLLLSVVLSLILWLFGKR